MRSQSPTPILDKIAVIMAMICLGMISMTVVLRMPELSAIARLRPRPCGRMEAWRGLRQHRHVNETAPEIEQQSKMLRLDRGYRLWQTPQGLYWVPDLTSEALWILLGQQKLDIYNAPESNVQQGDVVLDCGAHVGVFTRVALNRGARQVIAIEPAPENLECLRRNFSREIQSGKVVIYPKGVWNQDDVLPMYLNRNSAGDSFVIDLDPGQSIITLPLTTIDRIASELRLTKVDFIKMDIKGAEVRALEGARDVLRQFKPRLAIASEHLKDDPERISQTVRTANSTYQMQCGSCYTDTDSREIRPEVLHFY